MIIELWENFLFVEKEVIGNPSSLDVNCKGTLTYWQVIKGLIWLNGIIWYV